jgi:hypothetical protein
LSQPGTKISVHLRIQTDEPNGLLNRSANKKYITPLHDFVASLCPSIDVNVCVEEEGKRVTAVAANDWLNEQAGKIILRASGDFDNWDEHNFNLVQALLRDLKEPEGEEIYGRACICPISGYFAPSGVVTVGGLRASEVFCILGVLKGEAQTVARNQAMPTVTASVLRDWATEQAKLIAASKFRWPDKLFAASLIMKLGGNVKCLPIAINNDEYVTEEILEQILQKTNEVEVYDSDSIEYDEDDNVLPKDFRNGLVVSETLFLVPDKSRRNFLNIGEKIWPDCISNYKPEGPTSCIEAFVSILKRVWGVEPELEESKRVVGWVNDIEIERSVGVYSRSVDISEFV